MVEQIKLALRISHNKLDSVIQREITNCLADLQRVGVDVTNVTSTDTLQGKACELWVKAEFDHKGKGEEFKTAYEMLRDSLAVSENYREDSDV